LNHSHARFAGESSAWHNQLLKLTFNRAPFVTSEVTYHLPAELVQAAQLAAASSSREVDDVVAKSLQSGLRSLSLASKLADFTKMDDDEVLRLADSQMPSDQSDRLSQLLDHQREGHADRLELAELDMLLHFYQTGQLLKASALAEAVQRGLREPLAS
jgi:hypothetical protein